MSGYTECCARCRLTPDICVCERAPRLTLSTRVIVVMHKKEWWRSTNTGHLVRLSIEGAQVRLHGLRKPVDTVGVDFASPSNLALYPGRGAELLTDDYVAALPRPCTLLIPDGTWNQTKSMMRRVSMLREARPVRLAGPTVFMPELRQNRNADRMSTFQAIAHVLGLLEGRDTEIALLDFYRCFLERLAPKTRKRRMAAHFPSRSSGT